MRRTGVKEQRARAAVMTAVLSKTSRGGRGLKVDIKTRKKPKPGGETRTAAQGTVTTKKKRRDGLTVAKSESRTPTETQTHGRSQRRRGGKTGKQQVRRSHTIVLETKMYRHDQTHSSGNDQESYKWFLCLPQLRRGLFSAGPFCIALC